MATPKVYVNNVLTLIGRPGDSAESLLDDYLSWWSDRPIRRIDWGRAVIGTECFPGQCDCHRTRDAATILLLFGEPMDYRHHFVHVTGAR